MFVRGVGKEQLPPVSRELHEGRSRVFKRGGHILAQHATQRRQQRGKAIEIDFALAVRGNERLPREKIAQEAFDGVRVPRRGGPPAIGGDIARQTDDLIDRLAIAVKCPLIAIGVEDIRHGRKAFELIAIAAPKPGGGRADARGFEFDISGEQPIAVNRVIRSPDLIGQGRFARTDDTPTERASRLGHKGLKRPAHLVFRLAEGGLRHLGGHRLGKILQCLVD